MKWDRCVVEVRKRRLGHGRSCCSFRGRGGRSRLCSRSRRVSVVVRLVARTGCWELRVLGLLVDREGRSEAKCRVLLVLHGIRPAQ